jgi:transposase
MKEVSIIGLDLAKNLFQAHGAAADGSVVFRRKLTNGSTISVELLASVGAAAAGN